MPFSTYRGVDVVKVLEAVLERFESGQDGLGFFAGKSGVLGSGKGRREKKVVVMA